MARNAKYHSSYYPCEYCQAKGHLLHLQDQDISKKKTELINQKCIIENQIREMENNAEENENRIEALKTVVVSLNAAVKSLNRKNNIVWPASTRTAEERTSENILDIVKKIENNDVLSIDDVKGINGRSLLLDIPYFNIVNDMPVEYLHSTCLGVGKRMLELTFSVGETRQRNSKRKLSPPQLFNDQMASIKVTRDSSRRARNLDFSVMKGQEIRNIILIFFPLVVNCIEQAAKERRLWLLFSYMTRLCVLPEAEFDQIENANDILEYCSKHFYNLYEKLFNSRNCTYYVHSIGSHVSKIRCHGPLTFTSAFGFESFYAELRNSFTPGTRSPLKQAAQRILFKRSVGQHCCQATIFYSPKETPYESNCQIYTFSDNEYSLFKIISVENDSMTCQAVGKYKKSYPETPTLDWSKIGVFKAGGISNEIVSVDKINIAGKFLKVDDLFITCPNNVLLEK